MKKLLVVAVAVSLCASAAWAGDYYPIKDSGVAGHSAEDRSNGGAMTNARFMKGRQHYLLMDFDWVAIGAEIAATPGGYARLSLVPIDDSADYRWCSIQLAGNNVDWVEGDGDNSNWWINFNWTDPDVNPAVTDLYSQTLAMANPDYNPDYDPDNPVGSPDPWILDPVASTGAWPFGSLDGKRAQPGYRNANDLTLGLGGVRAYVDLDAAFVGHLVAGTTPDGEASVGLYTYDSFGFNLNSKVYTSEQNQASSPMVQVVPEPASMLLIGLGGIGLLLRKRR